MGLPVECEEDVEVARQDCREAVLHRDTVATFDRTFDLAQQGRLDAAHHGTILRDDGAAEPFGVGDGGDLLEAREPAVAVIEAVGVADVSLPISRGPDAANASAMVARFATASGGSA